MFQTVESFHHNAFFGVLAVLALLELYAPCRGRAFELSWRWPCNIGFFVVNTLLQRFVLPISAIMIAASPHLSYLTLVPQTITGGVGGIVFAILVLDFSKYLEHRFFHRYRVLWRFHLVHHADTELDFTTGERHHPVEMLLAYPIMLTLVVLLGLSAEGVAVYAIFSAIVTVWTHADVHWPARFQKIVRAIFVTPDMHEVHHSADRPETDSNYGLVFSVWDRCFGTYSAPTAEKSARRVIGLQYLRDVRDHRLLRALSIPFVRDPFTQQHGKAASDPTEGTVKWLPK